MESNYSARAEVQSVSSIIHELIAKDSYIELNPSYQRDVIWSDSKQSYFIDSVMKGIVPHPIIFSVDDVGKKTCVDGKQRLTSIKKFYNNEIAVEFDETRYYYSDDSNDDKIDDNFDILTKQQQSIFNNAQLQIIKYTDLTDSEQIELFKRIQNGVSASQGEIIPSSFSNDDVRKLFKEKCDDLKDYVKKFNKNIKRKDHYVFLRNLLYLIHNKSVTSLTQKRLESFIKTELSNIKVSELLLKSLGSSVRNIFSDDLFGHDDISSKLKKNILVVLSYTIHKTYSNDWKKLDIYAKKKIRIAVKKILKNKDFYDGLKSKNDENTLKKIVETYEKYLGDDSDSNTCSSYESDNYESEKPKKVIMKKSTTTKITTKTSHK
jgi:hypothetical protein